MNRSTTDWVAEKLNDSNEFDTVEYNADGQLIVSTQKSGDLIVAVLGVKGEIDLSDVEPLFAKSEKPMFVVNIPSKTLWSGGAIDYIHSRSASFGTLGDISRAASSGNIGAFRDKNMCFFIRAMKQHTNVSKVSYIYDILFSVERLSGKSLIVAVIEAYNMSAEDVRNARDRLGPFDIVLKSTSYGSITTQAEMAAKTMGADAMTFKQAMARLGR